jgi:hypothetical protein
MFENTVDAVAQLCFKQACDEVLEIMGGEKHIAWRTAPPAS